MAAVAVSEAVVPPPVGEEIEMKLTESDLSLIEQAVKDVEATTRGEIVPLLLDQSRAYPEAYLLLVLGGGIASGLASYGVHEFLGPGWTLGVGEFAIEILSGIGLALLATLSPWIRRKVLDQGVLADSVHRRALAEFTEHGVMNTNDRCGVLLLVSLFEHRAEIIADRGIHAVVPEGYWKQELDQMMQEIHVKGLAPALDSGIRRIGDLMAVKFPREAGTTNELADHLRKE